MRSRGRAAAVDRAVAGVRPAVGGARGGETEVSDAVPHRCDVGRPAEGGGRSPTEQVCTGLAAALWGCAGGAGGGGGGRSPPPPPVAAAPRPTGSCPDPWPADMQSRWNSHRAPPRRPVSLKIGPQINCGALWGCVGGGRGGGARSQPPSNGSCPDPPSRPHPPPPPSLRSF